MEEPVFKIGDLASVVINTRALTEPVVVLGFVQNGLITTHGDSEWLSVVSAERPLIAQQLTIHRSMLVAFVAPKKQVVV